MKESDLVKLGFNKVEIKHAESQNGYDYYYYIFEVFNGLTLCSVDSDRIDEEGWVVTNLEWPEQFRINSPQEFQSFLQAVGYQQQA